VGKAAISIRIAPTGSRQTETGSNAAVIGIGSYATAAVYCGNSQHMGLKFGK